MNNEISLVYMYEVLVGGKQIGIVNIVKHRLNDNAWILFRVAYANAYDTTVTQVELKEIGATKL